MNLAAERTAATSMIGCLLNNRLYVTLHGGVQLKNENPALLTIVIILAAVPWLSKWDQGLRVSTLPSHAMPSCTPTITREEL
jgi:hypothetical protein